MSLIDERERKFLLEWAKQNQKQHTLDIEVSNKDNSYFKTRMTEENCIMPYQFSTLKEIEEYEEKVCAMGNIKSDVRTVIAVAALKNKPQVGKITDVATKQDQIPEFIYIF